MEKNILITCQQFFVHNSCYETESNAEREAHIILVWHMVDAYTVLA
jgi:hypothetical protein